MGKHGSSKARTPERKTSPPPQKPAAKPAPAAKLEPSAPKAPPVADSLPQASRRALNAASQVLGHLEHAPGCPFGGGGPCTCGYTELVAALDALRTALSAS